MASRVPGKGATNAAFLLGEKVISLGAIAAANVVILRALGPAVYGSFGAATAVLAMCLPLTLFGNVMIVRSLSRPQPPARALLRLATLMSTSGAVLGGCAMVVLALAGPFGEPTSHLLLVLVLALLARPLSAIDVWFQATSRNPEATRVRTVVTILAAIGRIVVAVSTGSLLAMAAIVVLESVVAGILLRVSHVLRSRTSRNLAFSEAVLMRPHRNEIVVASTWYLGYSMAIILFMRIDQPMILLLSSPTQVGIYAAAANLSDAFSFLPNALLTASLPLLGSLHIANRARYEQKSAMLLSVGAGIGYVLAVFGIVAAPLVVPLLYGEDFGQSVTLLQILLLGMPFLFVGILRTPQIIHEGLQREVMWIGVLTLILNVGLNLMWIPTWGAIGAASATTICHVFNGVVGNAIFPRTRFILRSQIAALSPITAARGVWLVLRERRI
jgi:PST family polysaccharide transporter